MTPKLLFYSFQSVEKQVTISFFSGDQQITVLRLQMDPVSWAIGANLRFTSRTSMGYYCRDLRPNYQLTHVVVQAACFCSSCIREVCAFHHRCCVHGGVPSLGGRSNWFSSHERLSSYSLNKSLPVATLGDYERLAWIELATVVPSNTQVSVWSALAKVS